MGVKEDMEALFKKLTSEPLKPDIRVISPRGYELLKRFYEERAAR